MKIPIRYEIKTCIKCGVTKEIIQRYKHANNICLECSNQQAKLYARSAALKDGRRIGVNGRLPYPAEGGFEVGGRKKLYRIKAQLDKCNNREEWIELIRKNLDTTLNNEELMHWIKSTKDDDTLSKPKKKIETDYPDTRYMNWDEYERGLGEEDVDS
jgi:hypothetical protein